MNQPTIHKRSITVSPGQQGRIEPIPFVVPSNTSRITVALPRGSSPSIAIIDLGVADPSRVRGWSGGARQSFHLSEQSATPGYLKGPLPKGTWTVLLGLYRLPKEPFTLSVEIQVEIFSPRWIPGDLHLHSTHSDGLWDLDELIAEAASRGLQFIAFTDHNTASQNFSIPALNTSLTLIPGMEWTTSRGHANVWGLVDPLPDWRVLSQADVDAKSDSLLKKGALISINHPFDAFQPGVKWDWEMANFPCVEVWNGPWRPTNMASVNWWDEQLRQGYRITAVGGSDFHAPGDLVRLGEPTTWVWADTPGPSGILDGIRKGNVFITANATSPQILSHQEPIPFTHMGRQPGTLSLSFDGVNGQRIRLIDQDGVVAEHMVDGDQMELSFRQENSRYLRIEVHQWHHEWRVWMPQVLTNPIYFEPSKEPLYGTHL